MIQLYDTFYYRYFGVERLTATELKLLLYLTRAIRNAAGNLENYPFSIKNFSEAIGQKRVKYHEIRLVLQSLERRKAEINVGELNIEQIIFSKIKNTSSQPILTVNRLYSSYLFQMSKIVNDYEIELLLKLKSSYCIMFYILIKDYIWNGDTFTIPEFKYLLGIRQEEYPLYANFKARILNPIINELPNQLGLTIEFLEIKDGSKVLGLQVELRRLWDYQHLDINYDDLYDEIKLRAKEVSFDLPKSIFKRWIHYGEYAIYAALDRVSSSPSILNPIGYIDKLLKSEVYGAKLTGISYEEYKWIAGFIEDFKLNTGILSKYLVGEHFKANYIDASLTPAEKDVIWRKAEPKILTDLENIRHSNLQKRMKKSTMN